MATINDPSLLPGAVEPDEKNTILDRLLGFYDIKSLLVAIDHRLPTLIAGGAATAADLAAQSGLPDRSVRFLLIALGGMALVEYSDGRYALTPTGAKYFVEESPYYQGQYVRYWSWLFDALSRLPEGLAEDKPIWEGFSHYLKEADLETSRAKERLFNDAMSQSQIFVAHTVFRHVDLTRHRHLLDIGGSLGRFAGTALAKHPHLSGTVFDLPQVCPLTLEQARSWGLGDRLTTVAGDFISDDWPTGHDVVSIIRILNTRTDEVAQLMLAKAFASLPSGGRLILADAPILPSSRRYGRLASRLAMLYVMSSRGEVRHTDEWTRLIRQAGFAEPEVFIDDPYGILTAVKE